MIMSEHIILPDWPAPDTVKAVVSTRQGGSSVTPFDSFNLGLHVGDDAAVVMANREQLMHRLSLPAAPLWLQQVHGTDVVNAAEAGSGEEADASYVSGPGAVCAVMTADCLPALFCNKQGTVVAAAHAGWRGLAAGVLEATLTAMGCDPADILVWLGPAIGPAAFEVGNEVREAFVSQQQQAEDAFSSQGDKWLADIYSLARLRLHSAGVSQCYGGEYCTYTDAARFYSYRRDGQTGRMASLIWLDSSN